MERLRSECITCLLKNQLSKVPEGITEEEKIEYLQKMFSILAAVPRTMSAPEIVSEINELKRDMFQIEDEFGEIKRHFNQVMMEYEEEIGKKIRSAEDPLKLALQYAMVGNYIDFGAMQNVDEKYLTDLLGNASEINVDGEQYSMLKDDLTKGENFVLLTDNCGEVVMDKLLISEIKREFPNLQITVLVRGKEVLNDATMMDAEQIGLTDIVEVKGNGSGIAGTCLEKISDEARSIIDRADVIIAKGQGNFETLRGCGLNVYYAFLCKCDMFAGVFNVERFTGMLVNDKYAGIL